MLPLAGIKVIDLTTIAMGPYASQWLGDFGADVIKVEAPAGDSTRSTGPARESNMASIFLGTNRNKRSVVLDLQNEAAHKALMALVDGADIFMHNIRPQKLAKLGLDPQTLLGRNSRLVYAGLHGFAEKGPYGGKPAYDDIIQGLSGCVDLVRRQTGVPGYFPSIVADKTTGLIAAMAILAALRQRDVTGRGGFVEIPMFESMVAFNFQEHLYGQHFDPPLAATGYPRVMSLHRRPYKTENGHICMMPYTSTHWRAFFEEAGAAHHADDGRFADMAARTQNIDALYSLASDYIRTKSTAAWLEICTKRHIPAAPVLSLEELLTDPHLKATGFFTYIDDPEMGRIRFTGVPVLFDGERPGIKLPPRLGQHTLDILKEMGLPPENIDTVPSGIHARSKSRRALMTDVNDLPKLGQGFYWQDIPVGTKFRTFRRTLTEADLVNFISVTGMLEAIFIDADHGGAMGGRPVPAALTYAIIEGIIMQGMIQGTGMALLEVTIKVLAPVRVGDSIWASVEVTRSRLTSKNGRAVVTSDVHVLNQREELVMTYVVTRLLAGRSNLHRPSRLESGQDE
jgi:crotonobetainyl-CoA:carnitine CoA-transferase CaiB-like acyl-CoA transferase/acyl dehydratase